ncbi:hypothetical protein LguiA_029593 [Lonicera macranthoides]
MASMWSRVMKIQMKELKSNIFLVQFSDEEDLKQVINDGPWTFDYHLFVFKRLEVDMIMDATELTQVDFWIHVYDLPVGLMSERVARDVGNFIGHFVKSDLNNFSGHRKGEGKERRNTKEVRAMQEITQSNIHEAAEDEKERATPTKQQKMRKKEQEEEEQEIEARNGAIEGI